MMAALQTPPPQNPSHHPALVNPTVFFDIALISEPLGRVSLELFADKFPKTAENFCVLYTEEKDLVLKVPAFTG